MRNSGTRAAFVKAVCYSGTVEIKLAIYDVFYNKQHRPWTDNKYSGHFTGNLSDKVNLIQYGTCQSKLCVVVQVDIEQSSVFVCCIFIIIYYHAPEQRKVPNCTVPRVQLNHNIRTQISLTELLLMLLQNMRPWTQVNCVQSIMCGQLLLFKCDVAYSVFVIADSHCWGDNSLLSSQHFNATYHNIVGLVFASSGQTIATFEYNILQHCSAQHVAHVWPTCCDVLQHVGY